MTKFLQRKQILWRHLKNNIFSFSIILYFIDHLEARMLGDSKDCLILWINEEECWRPDRLQILFNMNKWRWQSSRCQLKRKQMLLQLAKRNILADIALKNYQCQEYDLSTRIWRGIFKRLEPHKFFKFHTYSYSFSF